MKWPAANRLPRVASRLLVLVCLLMVVPSLAAQDTQSWNEVDLSARWQHAGVLLPVIARLQTKGGNPQLAATGVLVDVLVSRHIIVTAGYLYANLPQNDLSVHVPVLAGSWTARLGPVAVSDRNRFEKLVGYTDSPWRYRNRLLVDYPLGAQRNWHVFASEEPTWNVTDGAWNQNRFQVGGGRRLGGKTLVDLYYLRKDAAGSAQAANVAGITARFALKGD